MFDTPVSTETDLAETASRPLASVQPASRPVASQRLESQLLDPRPTDPRKKCPDLLANEITTLAGHLNAAQYRFLKLLDEFDREQGWAGPGVRSLAHWLNWKCGLGDLVAREKVRVARALRELPMIDATFERGQLLVKALDAMVAEMEADEREAASETTENVSAETFSVGKPDTPPFKPHRVRRATALVNIAEHHRALHRDEYRISALSAPIRAWKRSVVTSLLTDSPMTSTICNQSPSMNARHFSLVVAGSFRNSRSPLHCSNAIRYITGECSHSWCADDG